MILVMAAAGAGLLFAGSRIASDATPVQQVAGQHAIWDGSDDAGTPVSIAGEPRVTAEPADAAARTSGQAAAKPSRTTSRYAFAWPAAGSISQGMSIIHPSGIDVRAAIGDPIEAVRAGKVRYAGGDPCCVYGYYVIVDHGEGWTSLYGHLSEISVEAGDHVQQGDVLGLAGNTGRSDGAHLHFELWSESGPVNPLSYLEPTRYYIPVHVVADATEDEGPKPEPEPEPVPQEQAIDRAVLWMEGPAGDYAVERESCFAIAAGLNWSVSCSATLIGCQADVCVTILEACVVGPLSLVEATCSGYRLSQR